MPIFCNLEPWILFYILAVASRATDYSKTTVKNVCC